MITLKLVKSLNPRTLLFKSQRAIISSLFRKKYQAEAPKTASQSAPHSEETDKKQQKEPEDHSYDFFERRKEIDTSFDFSKLRELNTEIIPQDLGKGGLEEILYWSQSASTPEQITHVLKAFNNIHKDPKQLQSLGKHRVYLDDFSLRVIGNIYLLNSLELLREYALFAYTFKIASVDFWQKIEFKALKFFPQTAEEAAFLVDIGFIMGQFQTGAQIYNHVSKILQEMQLTIDQYVKLFLTFHMLKIGQKEWINKLLRGISDKMYEANAQQLAGVLSSLKESKNVPEDMEANIEKRAIQIIDTFNVSQLLNIVEYFGFDFDKDQTWKILEAKIVILLQGAPIELPLLKQLIHKVMTTYKFSVDFIRNYIVKPIQDSKLSILEQLSVTTLSALSKGLYIYELETETRHFQVELSKLVISKMTKEINQLTDSQVVKVIQDYNLTRNGSRELYIFLEEVVKVRYLRGFNPELDRHTIELLLEIYSNSGMCTCQMYEGLQTLIMDE